MKTAGIIFTICLLVFVSAVYLNKENRKEHSAPLPALESKEPEENANVARPLPGQEGLPPEVEAKRQEIAKVAQAHDHKALASLADKENFMFSFGADSDFEAFLRESETRGDDVSIIIPSLLVLPYHKYGGASSGYSYYWPYFFMKELETWNEEDMALLRTIATEEEIAGYKEYGAYVGYRLAIRENGRWTIFIAGD